MRGNKCWRFLYLLMSVFIFELLVFGCSSNHSGLNKNVKPSEADIETIQPNDLAYQEEYNIIPNNTYYVLIREGFEDNDEYNPNISSLVRVYLCYDGSKQQVYPVTDKLAIDKVDTIKELRSKLGNTDRESLKLRPYTIVNRDVLQQWKIEGYSPTNEYSLQSPEGLTFKSLVQIFKS